MQLLRGMSISRYMPPKGTAGLDRSSVSGISRVPLPPAMMTVSTSFIDTFSCSPGLPEQTHWIRRQSVAFVFDRSGFVQQNEMGYSLHPKGLRHLRIRVI